MNKNARCNSPPSPRRWVARAAARAATAAAFCGALLWSAGRLAAQTDGVWNVTTNGNAAGTNFWSTATNWQGSTVANGTDAIADFSQLTLSGDETIHLDAPRTIGALAFGDQGYIYNWTLDDNQQASNTLTLATNYFPQPAISVNSGVATISAAIAGNQGFELNPQGQGGTLILSGANTYTGTASVNSGTLQAGAVNTFPAASAVSVSSGGTLMLNGFSQTIYALAGAGNVTNNSITPATLNFIGFNFDPNADATIPFSGVISDTTGSTAGRLSLAIVGYNAQVTLTGTNTYTGTTTINGGTLTLDFSNLVTPTNIISPSSPLVLGGGSLAVTDSSGSAATLQAVNGTTITAPSSVAVTAGVNSNPSSALVLGALTRNAGGSVTFTLPSVGNITTTTPNTNGIIGPWAIVGGTDWAANSGIPDAAGGFNIVAYSGYSYDYTDASAATPTANYGWGPGNNASTISANPSTTDAIAAGSTVNSLLFATASNYTITLSGANTVTSGGILISSATEYDATITIGGSGSLTVGAAANELVVTNLGGALTISAALLDNGSGSTALTYTGPAALTLTNAGNSFGGVTTINGGYLQISADHDLGDPPGAANAGGIVINNGTLQTTGTFTLNANRGIALGRAGDPGAEGTIRVLSGTLNYGGVIADNGSAAELVVEGPGALALTGANTYSGGTDIFNGTLSISSDAALGATTANPNIVLAQAGTLQLAAGFSGQLSSSRSIQSDGAIDTNGNGTATAPIVYDGTLAIAPVFTKAGAGVLELDSTPEFMPTAMGAGGIAVAGGTLRLNYPSPLPYGLRISISDGATLELAGPAPQFSPIYGANVANFGALLISSSVSQAVGKVTNAFFGEGQGSPQGATIVDAGSNLTAYQLVQNSLTIHGTGTTAATAGSVTLVPSGSGSTTNPTGPNNINFSSTLTSLSIDNDGAPVGSEKTVYYGTLDIGNNGLVIAYGSGPDPYAQIDDMIRSGYNGGTWTGTGITSSLAAAAVAIGSSTPALNIGLLDFTPGAGNYSNTTYIVFEGQTVTTNAILLRLTYMDDLVLAGDMSAQDAASDALLFAANYGTGTTWSVGDLEHTGGPIDSSDALLFAANYVVGLSSLDGTTGSAVALGGTAARGSNGAAVPEPSSIFLAALGSFGLGLLARRRTR